MRYFKNSKITNNEKGITLIVLIVTIVVLLVLAGVAVANITGGEGIIKQASDKRDDANIATEKQILSNAVITATNNSKLGEITENNLREALSNKNVDIVKSGGLYRITFKDTNNLYKMNKDGEFFAWEDMEPTDIYAKKDGTILYLRSTQPDTSYVKGTKWNDSTISKVIIEEQVAPSTCFEMFKNCSSLQTIENLENLHTENVKNFSYMFSNCRKLKNINFNSLEVENATTIERIFYYCTSISSFDLTNWDVKNIKSMYGAFQYCTGLSTINLKTWNPKSLTSLGAMFAYCAHLQNIDLSTFSVENVKDFTSMFVGCTYLKTVNIQNWNTNSVKDTRYMFSGCMELTTIYVSNNFNTENITASTNMFLNSPQIIGGNGTSYNSDYIDVSYARIDDPENGKPGYFTLKTTE